LHSILIGILLVDGFLYRGSNSKNARLEMSFGEKYKNYAEFISEIFKDFMNKPVKSIKIKGKNKVYLNYRLKTASLPIFVKYFDIFYKFDTNLNKYVKIIPENIIELLDSIVLAYLLMSDGNFDKNRNRIRIYTNSFTKQEVRNLSNAINSKFNIYTNILHDRKDQ
jgi:LAGLIDADG DNA endonuclease family